MKYGTGTTAVRNVECCRTGLNCLGAVVAVTVAHTVDTSKRRTAVTYEGKYYLGCHGVADKPGCVSWCFFSRDRTAVKRYLVCAIHWKGTDRKRGGWEGEPRGKGWSVDYYRYVPITVASHKSYASYTARLESRTILTAE